MTIKGTGSELAIFSTSLQPTAPEWVWRVPTYSIGGIAAYWMIDRVVGFWHFGEFSRAYKNCFGEVPSRTLKENSG